MCVCVCGKVFMCVTASVREYVFASDSLHVEHVSIFGCLWAYPVVLMHSFYCDCSNECACVCERETETETEI